MPGRHAPSRGGLGIDEVVAEVTPEGKGRGIHKLKADGALAFAGDVINDAPALRLRLMWGREGDR